MSEKKYSLRLFGQVMGMKSYPGDIFRGFRRFLKTHCGWSLQEGVHYIKVKSPTDYLFDYTTMTKILLTDKPQAVGTGKKVRSYRRKILEKMPLTKSNDAWFPWILSMIEVPKGAIANGRYVKEIPPVPLPVKSNEEEVIIDPPVIEEPFIKKHVLEFESDWKRKKAEKQEAARNAEIKEAVVISDKLPKNEFTGEQHRIYEDLKDKIKQLERKFFIDMYDFTSGVAEAISSFNHKIERSNKCS